MGSFEETVSIQKQPVGIALFGLGNAGTLHFNALLKNTNAKLLYIVGFRLENRQKVEQTYHLSATGCQVLSPTDDAKIFADPRVKAIIIATSTESHTDYILKAIKAGKHVFCEKPIARSEEAIKEVYAKASLRGIHLFCAFNRRFDPALRSMKERLLSGEIGNVHLIKNCARDSPPPSLSYLMGSGGIFHDCAVHDIDAICWLMGDFPVKVSAFGSVLHKQFQDLKNLDFDSVVIQFRFKNGQLATIDLSRCAKYGYDQRCEIFGSKGMLTSNNTRPINVVTQTESGSELLPIYYSFPSRYLDSFKDEIGYFVNLVSGEFTRNEITGDQVIAAAKIANACEKSAKNGGIPITLEW